MFTRLYPYDEAIAEGSSFSLDEVQYNLIHRISESADSFCIKTLDGKVIFAQTPGQKGWLWISPQISIVEQKEIIQELVSYLKGFSLAGISSEPPVAAMFAEVFSKKNAVPFETDMTMEAYHCPIVIKPLNVLGEIHKATIQNLGTIEEYLTGFLEDAFGIAVEPSSQLSKAKSMVEAGNVYLWILDGQPVSMANISHRSPRYARINAVFTPIAQRKNGFASAIVAELCTILETEKIVPMLYADIKNPASNKVYQNIGFIKSGKITEIKFLDIEKNETTIKS